MELSQSQPTPQPLKPVIGPRTYADLWQDPERFSVPMGRLLEVIACLSLNAEGICYARQRYLADKVPCSRRYVQIIEDRLVAGGYIHVQHRRAKTSLYKLLKAAPVPAARRLGVAHDCAPHRRTTVRHTVAHNCAPHKIKKYLKKGAGTGLLFDRSPQEFKLFAALSGARDAFDRDPGRRLARAVREGECNLIAPYRRGTPRRIACLDHWTNSIIALRLVREGSDETELFELHIEEWNRHWYGSE